MATPQLPPELTASNSTRAVDDYFPLAAHAVFIPVGLPLLLKEFVGAETRAVDGQGVSGVVRPLHAQAGAASVAMGTRTLTCQCQTTKIFSC